MVKLVAHEIVFQLQNVPLVHPRRYVNGFWELFDANLFLWLSLLNDRGNRPLRLAKEMGCLGLGRPFIIPLEAHTRVISQSKLFHVDVFGAQISGNIVEYLLAKDN
jgi:hypothetical protein